MEPVEKNENKNNKQPQNPPPAVFHSTGSNWRWVLGFFDVMKTYAEKLRDPRWQKKRLEIMSRDSFTCRYCGDKEKTLNVHHKFYRKAKSPWDYDDECYVTLCEDCHKRAEKLKEDALSLLCETERKDVMTVQFMAALSLPKWTGTALETAAESFALCMGKFRRLEFYPDEKDELIKEYRESAEKCMESMRAILAAMENPTRNIYGGQQITN